MQAGDQCTPRPPGLPADKTDPTVRLAKSLDFWTPTVMPGKFALVEPAFLFCGFRRGYLWTATKSRFILLEIAKHPEFAVSDLVYLSKPVEVAIVSRLRSSG